MVARVRPVHRAPVVSVAPVPVVSAVLVPVVDLVAPVVGLVLVVVPVVRVAVRVRRVVAVHRVVAVVVGAKKNCSPARFATPNPRLRFPRASSSSNAVSRLRSSPRV